MVKVRLSEEILGYIKTTAEEIFGSNTEVYIFGSRTDINKRGGDIDIMIKTDLDFDRWLEKKIKFLMKLWDKLGEQKIDVVYYNPKYKTEPIHKVAMEEGVKL
ncbi:MAG: nucleotidyltransferase domain-containing protein [Hydrogenothermaceae bacterium]|nr:nucleotidyltransferase domain-containing protein [Hydrogenothermaceae bacterium]